MSLKRIDLKKTWVLLYICLLSGLSELAALNHQDRHSTYDEDISIFKSQYDADYLTSITDTSNFLLIKQQQNEWEILFDGKNTDKWKGVNSDQFPSNGWAIEEGSLVLASKGGGDIITREKYSNFELVLDFKLTRGANSGIKYFVAPMKSKKDGKMITNGPEYQIIDDYNHPEVKDHQHEEGSTAALYLIYAPQNKKLLPEGQWNQVRIIARGKHVEHWLNGVKVVSYERGGKDFRERVAATKFKDYTNYGEVSSGHVLLTDHGDKVYFKNIRIKRL